jgi:site-specific DNA-adenine methylase
MSLSGTVGDVRNYVEPFFGSGAVLMGRACGARRTETLNDWTGRGQPGVPRA